MFATFILGGLLTMLPAAAAAPDAATIIQRSVQANERDWHASPQYNFFETDRGKGGTRTYHVTMIDGSPYNELVATNGHPLSREQEGKEKEKLDHTMAKRRSESQEERAARIAKYEKERKRDRLLMDQMARAFNFKLERREKLGNFDMYVLSAAPRPGYQPPTMEAKVLTGMQGKLWIDTRTYQWVKVEAEVLHPVSIAGFLARVEPGTRFELEKMPVGDGIWLAKHFVMRSKAKVLGVVAKHDSADETYFRYSKAAGTPAPAQTSRR